VGEKNGEYVLGWVGERGTVGQVGGGGLIMRWMVPGWKDERMRKGKN